MRIPPYETTRLTFWSGDDVGVWVRAELPGSRAELQAIGEHVALAAANRSHRVFVWLYASGPALALTFVEAGRSEPLTYVAEPLMAWAYSGAGLGRA
jgi:hypothetical protein